MLEIRVHGLGGEGVVRLSEFLSMAAVESGLWSHCFPFFGTEVRGAAVKAFTRIDSRPIHLKSFIYRPDAVILTNPMLLEGYGVTDGLKDDGFLLVNTRTERPASLEKASFRVVTLDATRMALDIIGRPIVNTILLGGFLRLIRDIPLDKAREVIAAQFSGKIAELNQKALEAGYHAMEEVTA